MFKNFSIILVGSVIMVFTAALVISSYGIIPVSGGSSSEVTSTDVFSSGTLEIGTEVSLLIASQPENNVGYVSNIPGVATRFQQADKYGSIGLIAHNYLSGREFFSLQIGDAVRISDQENTENKSFRVVDIQEYQALQPNSIHSQFRDLATGEILSAHNLSQKVYALEGHLILQTCIEADGHMEWGRIFIIAEPI